ncbi:MAG: hypothetical protein SFX74_06300 [Fimbriimonadaceae bacterium]|nr:hypothetical protein [Fimbriimonadaceae bacterium]
MKKTLLSAFALIAVQSVVFAQAVQSGSTLTIVTPNTDDSFTVEVGQIPGEARVFGAPGVIDGALFRGISSIVIRTNGGNDKVAVKVEAVTVPSIDINTGAGQSEVDLDFKVFATPSASSTVRVVGGDDLDKVLVEMDSAAQRLTCNWTMDLRGGLNEGFAFVQSNDPSLSSAITINTFGGLDLDNWSVLMGINAPSQTVNLGGNLGAGMDGYLFSAKGNQRSNLALRSNLDLGLDMDKALYEVSEMATTTTSGQLLTGGGNDVLEAKFGGTLQGTGVFNTGDGDDLAVIGADRIAGAPRLLMGAGNDFAEMNAFLGFTGSPSSDGGAGFDAFKGIGLASNFEQIN